MDVPPPGWLGQHILAADGITPVPCYDLLTWAQWMETADRRIAQDLDEGDGEKRIWVTTIFLGLDFRHYGEGPPILWETMVFGGLLDGDIYRYTSHAAALLGHQEVCQRVAASLTKGTAAPTPEKGI